MSNIKLLIDNYVDENKENMIDDIMDLLKFKSITGRVEENQACLKCFLDKAESMGFKTMTTKAFDMGIVEYGQGEERLGILVHLDVVDIGDRDKWIDDPFEGTIRDGYLWGRGTADDKGAAVMSLYAMKAIKDLNLPMKEKIWLIVGTAEEGEWTDIDNFKGEFPIPDYGFTPDGEFPIYFAEKGYVDIELVFRRDINKGILELWGGDSFNTIPSKAGIKLKGCGQIEVHGVSSHSSTPEHAENAIVKLLANIKEDLKFDFADFIREYLSDSSYGGRLSIDDGGDTYGGEYTGKTTAVPTYIGISNRGVELIVNIRHKYGTGIKDVLEAFERHGDRYAYDVSIKGHFNHPMMVSKDLPFLKIMNDVYEEYGFKSEYKAAAGTSYAKSMDNFVSWGPIFPQDPQTAHMENECLSINTMLVATKIYSLFIARVGKI